MFIESELPRSPRDGMCDGMPQMTHRTTFALDEGTAQRLLRLAAIWGVSQAEVVRRSVAQADSKTDAGKPDPVAMLEALHASGGGLPASKASAYLSDVRKDRKNWRNK